MVVNPGSSSRGALSNPSHLLKSVNSAVHWPQLGHLLGLNQDRLPLTFVQGEFTAELPKLLNTLVPLDSHWSS